MRGGIRTTLLCAVVAAGMIGGPAATTAGAQEPVPPPSAPPSLPETLVPSWNECFQDLVLGEGGEMYGPTDINAMSANGSMAVATNRQGTVTVLRYPRPSYYDQVKYRTTSRDEDHFGALENEGAFLGLLVPDQGVTWLRDQPVEQRYLDDGSDTLEQVYTVADLGVEVVVTDTVATDTDGFVRTVDVRVVDAGVVPTDLQVVAYENFNLTVSRIPYFPVMDWCTEELNVDTATYDDAADAIVHDVQGVDLAAGGSASVGMAMGFDRDSAQHQVGGDAFEGTALPAGQPPLPTQDAYLDADDGALSGNTTYAGQTTGALATPLDLADGADRVSLVIAGGPDADGAVAALEALRGTDPDTVVEDKQAWFDRLLAEAPMPDTDDPAVLALAHRALVSLASVYDPESGAIVASIATQSPYGEDWPRDGAFFNHALDLIGQHDWVAKRLRWYADLQSDGSPGPSADGLLEPALVPAGNWAMNYYADGVVGGPIPWEIDETGYMLWAFWDHVEATGDTEVLADVYDEVRLAADFLTDCTDGDNGLQCSAFEDDNYVPSQTIHGAGPVWLGLDSAVKAAEALGEDEDAQRWSARRDELGEAIDAELFVDGVYGGANGVVVWPVCLREYDDPRFTEAHYDAVWDKLTRTFAQPEAGPDAKTRGLYESKGLLALAKATRDLPGWNDKVRSGLQWVATEHAEPDTNVMGEVWLYRDGDVVSGVSQPHVWEQVLFYLAAIEAWPPRDADVEDTRDCAGAIGRLRDAAAGTTDPAPDPTPSTGATPGAGGADPVAAGDHSPLPATGGASLALLGAGLAALALRMSRGRRAGSR